MEHTSQNKLSVHELGKQFVLHNRGGIKVHGFSKVSFTLHQGQLLALSGPSGAGKSSILKTIFRTYLADTGSVQFTRKNGATIDLAECTESTVLELRRKEMGFVTQFLKILPRISALDAVAQPLTELGVTLQAAREEARRLLSRLHIRQELMELSPLTFSGGEQQRVNIARAVIAPKELILLDEPTASLDERSSEVVLDIFQGLKKKGIALIAIFHDQNKIDQVADAVYRVERQH